MARYPRRSIPPVLDDPRSASLTLAQQRTLLLLPLAMDDAGRALDDPGTLNGLLWGRFWEEHPPADMDADLTALATAGFLLRYALDGVRYLAMTDWDEQQVLSRRQPSRIPAPPGGARNKAAWAGGGQENAWSSVDGLMNVFGGAAEKLHDPQVQAKGVRMLADLASQIDPALGAKVRDRAKGWMGPGAPGAPAAPGWPAADEDPVHPHEHHEAHHEHPPTAPPAAGPAAGRDMPEPPPAPSTPASTAERQDRPSTGS